VKNIIIKLKLNIVINGALINIDMSCMYMNSYEIIYNAIINV